MNDDVVVRTGKVWNFGFSSGLPVLTDSISAAVDIRDDLSAINRISLAAAHRRTDDVIHVREIDFRVGGLNPLQLLIGA